MEQKEIGDQRSFTSVDHQSLVLPFPEVFASVDDRDSPLQFSFDILMLTGLLHQTREYIFKAISQHS